MEYTRVTKKATNNNYQVAISCEVTIPMLLTRLGYLEDLIESGDLRFTPHAFWIAEKKAVTHEGCINWSNIYKCSKCGREEFDKEPFCNCGADMRRN